jgi:periplasmic divalent cation tolerance protein
MTAIDVSTEFPSDPALDARLADLRCRFQSALPQRLTTILQRLDRLEPGTWVAGAVDELQTEVHSLAGSAGLFGFDRVGAAAGEFERLLKRAASQPAASHADLEEINDAAAALQSAVRLAISPLPRA